MIQTNAERSGPEFTVPYWIDADGKSAHLSSWINSARVIGYWTSINPTRWRPLSPTVDCRVTLEQAFRLMQENSAATVGVKEVIGKLVGLVTSETLTEMMTLMAPPNRAANGRAFSSAVRWV